MKLCKDCRFFYGGNYCVRESILANEQRAMEPAEVDPVHGGLIRYAIGVDYGQSNFAFDKRKRGNCGMDATFFESK